MAKTEQDTPEEAKASYSGLYNEDDFKNWCIQGEANWNKNKKNFEIDRKYFENVQAPSDVPSDKTYVIENRSTDLVRRLTGQMISGDINLSVTGGGERALPLRMLNDDILEENDWKTLQVEEGTNNFYCEGYGGIKFRYNAKKLSKYGIGSPEIDILQYDELWLDMNSKKGMHTDDIMRIHPKRILTSLAKQSWPGKKKEITSSMEGGGEATETEKHCDLYEIEFKETRLVAEEIKEGKNKGKTIKLEKDVYFIVKLINKTVVVEGPEPTGYPLFRLIPMIHTPRKDVDNEFGRYPFGPLRLTSQTQDMLNVLASIIHEVGKASVKNLAIIFGATVDEMTEYKLKAAQVDGVLGILNINARVEWAPRSEISPALLQEKAMVEHRFDSSTSDYKPAKGDVEGDLSGKAIGMLKEGGVAGEYTAQTHLEYSFSQLSKCLIHCITTEMNTPFYIISKIEGDEKTIHYNTMGAGTEEDDEYNVKGEDGVINDMSSFDMQHMKISTEIQMNVAQQQNVEIQKAVMAHDRQAMAPIDFLKALFPKRYYEIWKNVQKHNEAMALLQKFAEKGPDFVEAVKQIMDLPLEQIEQMFGGAQQPQQQEVV